MKVFATLALMLFSLQLFADELKVEFSTPRPVAGEVFQAYFRIFTNSSEEPAVNFSPSNLEVVGKSNQGVSTRTVYANGKLTVTRELTVVYELVSSRPGTGWLRDITVQVGPQTLRHPSLSVTILKEPEVAADVFLMADVPKKELYVGEGVTVRYYLYSKVPVQNLDVKKYPKLNGFLKRFLQEPERTERVAVDGQIYLRSQIYAAKLFAEKAGTLKVDSLSLAATYPVVRSGDPFGAFGFSRELKTRTLNSETVKLDVRPLPEPVPAHFTGLVGKHEFELAFGKTKLIVNEPLEVKLTVTGVGALENLEAPSIIKNSALEEFESNGDLKIADAAMATKIFEYTFLPKENVKIPGSQMTLSYFDPDSGKYVPKNLEVPEIEVAGGSARSASDKKSPPKEKKGGEEKGLTEQSITKTFSAPDLTADISLRRFLPYVNMILAALALLIALSWVIRVKGIGDFRTRTHVPGTFRKGKFDFGEFARWMSPLIDKTGKTPSSLIRESDLDSETKAYFLSLLESSERGEFAATKARDEFVYDHRRFKQLSRYILSATNESSQQSL